jgi:sulfonate transport system substrate-binding protein
MCKGKMLAAYVLVATVLIHASSADAEPIRIRIAWVNAYSTLVPLLLQKSDLFRHAGQSYVAESIHFNGSSPQITGLAAGEIDIAALAFSSFGVAIENAKMDDLRVIADGFQDAAEGHFSNAYMVRKDSGITSVDDLKGKVLASNGVGGALDTAIRAMLRKHHLEDKADYTLIEAQFQNMTAMLNEKKVDLVTAVPPYVYDPALAQNATTLFTMKEALGPTQMLFFTARSAFIEKNRAALCDFYEDLMRSLHWFLNPANRADMLKLVAAFTKQPEDRFATWFLTKLDSYHDPDMRPDLSALQHNLTTQHDLGFLKTEIDVRGYADLSIVEEAAKRLK